MTFAEQLFKIMRKEKLTAAEIARKTGIDRGSISRYLNGSRIPSYETMDYIFDSLGYSVKVVEKSKNEDELRKNGSGYYDATAYRAIKKAEAEKERLTKLLDVIFTIVEYAGFHVEERIVLKDRKTGKIWR